VRLPLRVAHPLPEGGVGDAQHVEPAGLELRLGGGGLGDDADLLPLDVGFTGEVGGIGLEDDPVLAAPFL
jgi:hypothetical protein